MNAFFNGKIFRMDAESVKAHRLKNIVPLHSSETAVDIRTRKGVNISHVQAFGRRIREHHQVVIGIFGMF